MRYFIVYFILLSGHSIHSQADSVRMHNWLVTFSPSAFLNYHPGVQFGLEKYFNKKQSVEVEIARLFKIEKNFIELSQGARLKLGYKKHNSDRNIFFATVFLRRTTHDKEEWFWRFNDLYQEQILYRATKSLTGVTVGHGFASQLFKRTILEGAVHIGLASYFVRINGIPDDAVRENDFLFQFYQNEDNYFFPILRFSIKLKFDFSNHGNRS